MRIEIEDFTNTTAQTVHLVHHLESLVDAVVNADPHILVSEQINGRRLTDVLVKQMGRICDVVIAAEKSRWPDAA